MYRDRGFGFFPAFRLFFLLLMVAVFPVRAESMVSVVPNTVRIGLAQGVQYQDFHVQGRYRAVDLNSGKYLADVLPGEKWQVRYNGGTMQLYRNGVQEAVAGNSLGLEQAGIPVAVLGGDGTIGKPGSDDSLYVISGQGDISGLGIDGGEISLLSDSGVSTLRGGAGQNLVAIASGGGDRLYRGNMEFRLASGGITVINELPLEEYLYGVLPGEMPSSWPIEAQKAQAVAARSYALANLGAYSSYGFDLMSGQMSQVYGGYDAEQPAATRAVDETRGMVLLCRGEPVSAFFHSSSGGYIENAEDVWRDPLEYISSKADPFDKNDKYYNWLVDYDQKQLVSQLALKKALYNKPGMPERVFSAVDDIRVLEMTASGARVKRMSITGTGDDGSPMTVEIANADAVRSVLGLKSALFTMKKTTTPEGGLKSVSFTGSGYGHGLGMSQYGALGMANRGYNYRDILGYYYNNCQVGLLTE
ncbi:MAG: SpoIID/LytB domain-containing protein [Bacillota bacterium]